MTRDRGWHGLDFVEVCLLQAPALSLHLCLDSEAWELTISIYLCISGCLLIDTMGFGRGEEANFYNSKVQTRNEKCSLPLRVSSLESGILQLTPG